MDQPTFSLEGHEVNNQEELIFHWTIPNFPKYLEAADKNPDASAKKFVKAEISAGAGSKGGVPNWEFSIAIVGIDYNKNLAISLQYLGSGSSPAKCDIYFRSPAGKLVPSFPLPKQMYNEGSIGICRLGVSSPNISPTDFDQQEFFPNEVLQLQLNLTVPTPTPNGMQSKMDVLGAFKNGLNSQVGSDVTFVFEEEGPGNVIEEIRAHKAILSSHSPVFAEMFGNVTIEGTPTRMKISEMSPQGMKLLLQFHYSGEMDEDWKSVVEELIQATQKYQLGLMQMFLRENIVSSLTARNAVKIYKWGVFCGLPEVVAATAKFMMGRVSSPSQPHFKR